MHHSLRRTFITALLFFTSTPVFALDFLMAYELAKNNDPVLLAASFDYQFALDERPQTRSALLPQVSLDVFTNKTEKTNILVPPSSVVDFDSNGYTLTLTQSIYNHDLYLKLEQTDLNIAAATANYNAEKQALIIRIADAYFDLLAASDNLRFAQAEKNAVAKQLAQAKSRYQVGVISITDVKESQAQYDLSAATEIAAENQLSVSRETLRSIINKMPSPLKALAKNIPLTIPEPADIDQWVKTSKTNNLALIYAKYIFNIAQKQVDINQSGHYPSLNLAILHGDVTTDIDNTSATIKSDDTAITLNLSIPIYSGGLISAKIKSAISQQERARALSEKALRDTIKLSRDSYIGITTSIAQVKAFKQALASTQAAYKATQAGFEVGTRTAVEVLSVLRDQYRAERDYARSRYNYVLSILRLKQAAGILAKEDVIEINRWLQH